MYMKENSLLSTNPIDHYFSPPDRHEMMTVIHGGLISFFVAALTLFAEGMLVYHVLQDNLSWMYGLLLHACICLLLAGFYLLCRSTRVIKTIVKQTSSKWYQDEHCTSLLLLLTTLTTGPYGAGGILVMILLHLFFATYSQSFSAWFESIFPPLTLNTQEALYDNLVSGRDESAKHYSIMPFMEILQFGNEIQKRRAIAKMTSLFHPTFAPAFKFALQDMNNTVRVQAATAITKIENAFTERLIQLTELYHKHPEDPVVVWALAEHYDNYAFTGIMDAKREHTNRESAIKYYEKSIKLNVKRTKAMLRIGRLLLRINKPQEAGHWFEKLHQEEITPELLNWQAEALYATGQYGRLRQFAAASLVEKDSVSQLNNQVQEALRSWAESPATGKENQE